MLNHVEATISFLARWSEEPEKRLAARGKWLEWQELAWTKNTAKLKRRETNESKHRKENRSQTKCLSLKNGRTTKHSYTNWHKWHTHAHTHTCSWFPGFRLTLSPRISPTMSWSAQELMRPILTWTALRCELPWITGVASRLQSVNQWWYFPIMAIGRQFEVGY